MFRTCASDQSRRLAVRLALPPESVGAHLLAPREPAGVACPTRARLQTRRTPRAQSASRGRSDRASKLVAVKSRNWCGCGCWHCGLQQARPAPASPWSSASKVSHSTSTWRSRGALETAPAPTPGSARRLRIQRIGLGISKLSPPGRKFSGVQVGSKIHEPAILQLLRSGALTLNTATRPAARFLRLCG